MALRPTQRSTYALIHSGLILNQTRLARAQQEIATGKRILAPSDDAVGTAFTMSVRRQQAALSGWLSAIGGARPYVSTASSELQQGSNLVADARARIVEGMNGTLSASDRESIATAIEVVYDSLLEIANARSGDRYLFSGTATDTRPFVESSEGGRRVVRYAGDSSEQTILVARDVEIEINVTGRAVFAAEEFSGVGYGSLTGIAGGTSADSGAGYHDLHLRHDATVGTPGAGIALAGGGAQDSILGDHTLVVDATAGTVQLGDGAPQSIPSPLPASFAVRDADGSQVVLDFTGWTGADTAAVLTGQGSIALNDGAFQAITLTETDLELVDASSGAVLHVDTTGVTRAGTELVTYGGAANLFDTLRGAIDDLRNGSDLEPSEIHARLADRLVELDRNHRSLLGQLGRLGVREQRLDATEARLNDLTVHLESLRSSVEDADVAEVVLELSRAEQTLQIAQATGARLIQRTLLNFLG